MIVKVSCTQTNEQDITTYCIIIEALGIISSVATHVNETIREIDNFKKIIDVSKKLIGDVGDSLISPHRVCDIIAVSQYC